MPCKANKTLVTLVRMNSTLASDEFDNCFYWQCARLHCTWVRCICKAHRVLMNMVLVRVRRTVAAEKFNDWIFNHKSVQKPSL